VFVLVPTLRRGDEQSAAPAATVRRTQSVRSSAPTQSVGASTGSWVCLRSRFSIVLVLVLLLVLVWLFLDLRPRKAEDDYEHEHEQEHEHEKSL